MVSGSDWIRELRLERTALTGQTDSVSLLTVDPALARAVPSEMRQRATEELVVPTIRLPEGKWSPPRRDVRAAVGLLILDGLMSRRVRVASGYSVEPLGPGDLIRPWHEDGVSFAEATWEVHEYATLAFLDGDFGRKATQYPTLWIETLERGLRRARYLSAYAAIEGIVGVERRLIAMLWALAERWGDLEDGTVRLSLPLSHTALANLVGARRPTVTTALGKLRREGSITQIDGGWLLNTDIRDFLLSDAASR